MKKLNVMLGLSVVLAVGQPQPPSSINLDAQAIVLLVTGPTRPGHINDNLVLYADEKTKDGKHSETGSPLFRSRDSKQPLPCAYPAKFWLKPKWASPCLTCQI